MAYTNRHIHIRFDGTQVNPHAEHPKDEHGKYKPEAYDEAGNLRPIHYPALGDGVWVQIHNPMLMPQSMLLPKTDVAVGPDGRPLDIRQALDASKEIYAKLVTSWNVPDVFDLAEDPLSLPTPVTPDMFDRIPAAIGEAIGELIAYARNPR